MYRGLWYTFKSFSSPQVYMDIAVVLPEAHEGVSCCNDSVSKGLLTPKGP